MRIQSECFNALFLAFASSTDNFAIGFSLGLSSSFRYQQPVTTSSSDDGRFKSSPSRQRRELHRMNIIISITNAIGSYIATAMGAWTLAWNSSLSVVAPLLATLAFAHLAWNEYQSLMTTSTTNTANDKSSSSSTTPMSSSAILLELAFPLTLSNLAGGVAGGVVLRIPSWLQGIWAFVASYLMMYLGHAMACRIVYNMGAEQNRTKDYSSAIQLPPTGPSNAPFIPLYLNPGYWSIAVYLFLALVSICQFITAFI